MAAFLLLDDGSSIASSSILALARESHLPDPPHFHHGLLASTSSPRLDLTRKSHLRYATIICYRPLVTGAEFGSGFNSRRLHTYALDVSELGRG